MPPRRSKRLKKNSSPSNSSPPITSPNTLTQPSFFNVLSSEIRNEIYRHLVVKPYDQQPICPPVNTLFKRAENRETGTAPLQPSETVLALARTCRQAHNEVTAIYYGENEFSFWAFWDMQIFLYMIGTHNRQCIQSVVVAWCGLNAAFATDAAALLGECTKMKKLKILTVDPHSTVGAAGKDLFKGPRSRVLGLIRELVDVQLTVQRQYPYDWWFTEQHVKEFEKWLQEKMILNEESELVFKDEFEKKEEAEREGKDKAAREIAAERERKRKKKQRKGCLAGKSK